MVAMDFIARPRYGFAAGPGANFVMGLGWMAMWVILSYGLKLEQTDFFIQMCRAGIGVNSAMCDGSVRFTTNIVDSATWKAMGTMNGGESLVDIQQ